MRFGIQLYPPRTAPEMAAYAKKALGQHAFDKVWVPDHLTYENVFVILAAMITQTSAHVGTSVTHPWARTPVDLASSFAALAHLAGNRGITVGIGAGSPSSNMIRKTKRVAMVRETILFLREMFAGNTVKLGAFPALAEFFRLDANAEAFLRLPPLRVPEIFVAAAGPQMLKMAWDMGDGLIVSNLSFPTALVRQGAIDLAMAELEKARRARSDGSKFTKVLHLHVSVSCDGAAAKRFAKGMGAGALIQGHLLKQRMLKLPVPPATAEAVAAAHRSGKTADEMIDLIDDELLAQVGTVIAGTPAECIDGIDEMLRAAKPYGFDIVDMASPLGPNWDEAIDLICQEIIPEIERRSASLESPGIMKFRSTSPLNRNRARKKLQTTAALGLFLPLILSTLLGCTAAPFDARRSETTSKADNRLDAILWQTTSAEYRVLAQSIYTTAQTQLERALADPNWSALPTQTANFRHLPPAIIMDIDETVIDTGAFQSQMARNNARFSSRPWREWQERNQPTAIPGAVEFIAAAQARGVTVFFVTNRDHATEQTTRRNLAAIGVALPEAIDTVLCRRERADWSNDKESRRQFIAQTYRVLMLFGDDLGDFISDYRAAADLRVEAALKHNEWGTKWFMLPNPMYGSWEASLYGFRSDLTLDEISRQKFNKLR